MSLLNDPITELVSIVVNTADVPVCRKVYIGVAGDYEVCVNGTDWISVKGCLAGNIYPFMCVGIRKSGGAAPTAGDVLFLY